MNYSRKGLQRTQAPHRPKPVPSVDFTYDLGARGRIRTPLKVQALACVCGTGTFAHEALDMYISFRRFNPGLPVYIMTDKFYHAWNSYDLVDPDLTVDILTEEDEKQIAAESEKMADPNPRYWSKFWIAAKFLAMDRALAKYPRKGILLADSDLVFTGPVMNNEWDADLVLSKHAGPNPDNLPDKACGIYNAGMILFSNRYIWQEWKRMTFEGIGGFYEQKCLEDLAGKVLTDTFPASWNWGDWRPGEDISLSGRIPTTIHCHRQKGALIAPSRRSVRHPLIDVANQVLEDLNSSISAPEKLIFIHHPKSAGTTLNVMYKEACVRTGYQYWDSFNPAYSGYMEDWSRSHLDLLYKGKYPQQTSGRQYIHNHSIAWPREMVQRFIDGGWKAIAVYRPLKERLGSLYHWNRKRPPSRRAFLGAYSECDNIEDATRLALSPGGLIRDMEPHPEWRNFSYWSSCDSESLQNIVTLTTGVTVEPGNHNQSNSKGSSEFSPELHEFIEQTEVYKKWQEVEDTIAAENPSTFKI